MVETKTKTELEKMVKDVADQINTGDWQELIDNALEIRRIQSLVEGNWITDGYEIVVTTSGPNIWIDTRECDVIGAWWGENARVDIDGQIAAEIEGYLDEILG